MKKYTYLVGHKGPQGNPVHKVVALIINNDLEIAWDS